MALPAQLTRILPPETQKRVENFLQEFVVFTSHDRARIEIYGIALEALQAQLKEQMGANKPSPSDQ